MSIKNEAAKVHLVTCVADALQRSISAIRGGQWLCAASTTTSDPQIINEARKSVVMQIQLRGTLHGRLQIETGQIDVSSLLVLNGPEQIAKEWRHVMEGLVQRLPKRAADAGMFAFSVESFDLGESLEGSVPIGGMELSQGNEAACTIHVLADHELAESFRAAE